MFIIGTESTGSMGLILHIDTSSETAYTCLAEHGIISHTIENTSTKDHAAFLHTAIKELLSLASLTQSSLTAIAVSNGPGSYTGLRVGMAAAKGLCYALDIPFITVGTLTVMAHAVLRKRAGISGDNFLYCPMIDARRLEVYTAIFDKHMNELLPPTALILNENSFEETLKENFMLFFGSGAGKFEAIVRNEKAFFIPVTEIIQSLNELAFLKFINHDFTSLAYSEPFYLKEFHSSEGQNKK